MRSVLLQYKPAQSAYSATKLMPQTPAPSLISILTKPLSPQCLLQEFWTIQ